MNSKQLQILSILVGVALFVSVNLFSSVALRFWRLDLTEQHLFSLSSGTENILAKLESPITLRLFYTEDTASGIPSIETYARRVRELLEEFERAADGNIVLQVIDPEPFSQAEELATSYGIRGQLVNAGGDMLYLGLAATNDVDELEVIPTFDPRGEAQLEYDLIKIVYDLGTEERPHVAVLSSLPLDGFPVMMPGAPSSQGWQIMAAMRDSFEVETLNAADLSEIPDGTDVLLILHPKDLPDSARFAIDQFALGGGNVLALVDPYCYFDRPQGQNQFGHNRTSNLDALLGAWGVDLIPNKVVGDREMAQTIQAPSGPIPFPLWMELNANRHENLFSKDDFVTSEISLLNMLAAGALRAREGASTEVTPILRTSPSGKMIDSMNLQFAPDLLQLAPGLLDQFRPIPGIEQEDADLWLAVRITGEIQTAFPDGAPEDWTGTAEVLTTPTAPFHAIVIADVDFVHENLWMRRQQTVFGPISQRTHDNPVLLLNAIENLSGSDDLISLRSRGIFRRPFKRKEELSKAAQERFQAKFEELEVKSRELDAEIRELQKGADEAGIVRMTVQEFEALQEKQEEQVDLRREQREVRHQLSKDIKALGSRLKFINIALVPLLVSIAGLAFHMSRRRRRSA